MVGAFPKLGSLVQPHIMEMFAFMAQGLGFMVKHKARVIVKLNMRSS